MRTRSFSLSLIFSYLVPSFFFCVFTSQVSALELDWVTVTGPGNACDTQAQGCFGSVAYVYRISETEVTNAQYAEFLNAVAATDTNALYHTNMGLIAGLGGIDRSGISGS